MDIRVGSRESKLAVVQSEMVIDAIKSYDENINVDLITMKTTGDIILDKTLDKIGGKGLFVKELDKALASGQVDITVHSLKDMPAEIPEELPILAYSKREDPRDVMILSEGVKEIDYSKPIGCASLRRKLYLEKIFPEATFAPIRGNVQTRLKKLDEGQYSAIILAYAGIKRLGLEARVSRVFSVEEVLPAACQGILAVQGRAGDKAEYLSAFASEEGRIVAETERAFIKALDGGCSAPTAAYCIIDNDEVSISGFFVRDDGTEIRDSIRGPIAGHEELAVKLALSMKG